MRKTGVQRDGILAVAVAQRQHLVAEHMTSAGMVVYTAETLEMPAGLLQRGVVHDIEVRHVAILATTPLHDAEELLCHSKQQTASVIGGVGEKAVEAVLANAII